MILRRNLASGLLFVIAGALLWLPGRARAAAEVKFDTDFLAGVVAKVPPVPFQKEGRYRGKLEAFRLLGIDPRTRRFLIAFQVAGEFHSPLPKSLATVGARNDPTPEWKNFRFEIRAGVNIEAGASGTPRFQVEVEEVKRKELEGFAGALARVLGKSFDSLVTQVADGKASKLNDRLNGEVLKRIQAFKEYGVFRGIDYTATGVALYFDVSRFKSEGIAGHVFAEAKPGTVPLYRWVRRGTVDHVYSISSLRNDPRPYISEGLSCFVFPQPLEGTVPLYGWRNQWDHFYTTAADGERVFRLGYRPQGIVCYIYAEPRPGTVPLYRFVEPRTGQHFYTTHPHAEFAK